jgi:hypothetical protein
MWACPDCGREFANVNQWHSCLDLDVEEHLAGHAPHAIELYRLFQAAVEDCGEFRVHAQKTRIAFIARMTFAGARLAREWIDVSFITPTAINDGRVRSVELYGPTSFGHTVRLAEAAELDTDLRRWLCEAWRRGTRETLDPQALVAKVTGYPRSVLTVPLATRTVRVDDGLAVRLPGYAVQALGEGEAVKARIPGNPPEAARISDGLLHFDRDLLQRLGLGDGDHTDVFITAS